MGRVGGPVMRHGRQDLLRDQVLPVPGLPQQEVTQLMSQQRPELGLRQFRAHGTVQDDVRFARHKSQRSVQALRILRLVDGQRDIQPQRPSHVFSGRVDRRLLISIHSVGRLQQLESDCFGLFVTGLMGRIPVPDIWLFGLQILAQGLVIRQRLDDRRGSGWRFVRFCALISKIRLDVLRHKQSLTWKLQSKCRGCLCGPRLLAGKGRD